MENEVADVTPAVTGALNTNLGTAAACRCSPGPRDDPFFIDLEAAFCILPDRRPVGGALRGSCALQPNGQAPFYFRNPGINYVDRLQREFDRDRASQRHDRGQRARQARHLGHHQPVITHATRTRKESTMQLSTLAVAARRLALAGGVAAVSLAATACSDDNSSAGPATPRMYNQVQRLGNPLVSEVLLSKRSHPTHGSIGPDQDAALVAPRWWTSSPTVGRPRSGRTSTPSRRRCFPTCWS